jgi:hypothetical protein
MTPELKYEYLLTCNNKRVKGKMNNKDFEGTIKVEDGEIPMIR